MDFHLRPGKYKYYLLIELQMALLYLDLALTDFFKFFINLQCKLVKLITVLFKINF